jgi:hypothetical protein
MQTIHQHRGNDWPLRFLLTMVVQYWHTHHSQYETEQPHFCQTSSLDITQYACTGTPETGNSGLTGSTGGTGPGTGGGMPSGGSGGGSGQDDDEETTGREADDDEEISSRDAGSGSGSGGGAGARTGFDDYYINPETDVDNDTYIDPAGRGDNAHPDDTGLD